MSSPRVSAEPAGPARDKAFEHALEVLRERRDEFRDLGYVPKDYVNLLVKAGIYRASTPARFGGEPMPPPEFLQKIERISEIDPSTGWVASFGSALNYLAALPLETQEQLYADGPDLVFAGANFPIQEAEQVDGGYRVSGRWMFGSGCAGADWLGVGLAGGEEAQGRPVLALIKPEQATIDVTWDVSGMKSTGSNDIVLDDVFVPAEFTCIRGADPLVDEPTFRYPALSMAAQVLAVTAVGAARGALDYTIEVGSGGSSVTGGGRKAARPSFQDALARAEAQFRSARSFFYEMTEEVWAKAVSDSEISTEDKALLRLATTHVAHESRKVILTAFDLAGTGAIFNKHPMQRFLQDGLVPAQHAMMQTNTYEAVGALLLGGDVTIPSFP